MNSLRRAFFSSGGGKHQPKSAVIYNSRVQSVNPITKLQHCRLDLTYVLSENNLPLIRQNVINRKASTYADPDRVAQLHSQFRTLKHELD